MHDLKEFRGRPDEDIFAYAVEREAVVVTRDVRFANPLRFPLGKITGIIVLRFPNDVSIAALCGEMKRLIADLKEEDLK